MREVREIEVMQAYSADFAGVYNRFYQRFAREAAPQIHNFYARSPIAAEHKTLLDVCCGAGLLSLYFLERGFRVTGLDLSAPILEYARENTQPYIERGQARFVQGDAADFTLDERFGLVVSTFDALNHLPDADALKGCLKSARAVTLDGGMFVFDLYTRAGLKKWNNIRVEEDDDGIFTVNHGIFDGVNKGYAQIVGFVPEPDGRYVRFEETIYNTAFDLEQVCAMAREVGWKDVYCARLTSLDVRLNEPERDERVFVVAKA